MAHETWLQFWCSCLCKHMGQEGIKVLFSVILQFLYWTPHLGCAKKVNVLNLLTCPFLYFQLIILSRRGACPLTSVPSRTNYLIFGLFLMQHHYSVCALGSFCEWVLPTDRCAKEWGPALALQTSSGATCSAPHKPSLKPRHVCWWRNVNVNVNLTIRILSRVSSRMNLPISDFSKIEWKRTSLLFDLNQNALLAVLQHLFPLISRLHWSLCGVWNNKTGPELRYSRSYLKWHLEADRISAVVLKLDICRLSFPSGWQDGF